METPKTLTDAIKYYSDPDNCLDYAVSRRWPNGVVCPTCGSDQIRFISTRRLFECKTKEKHTRKQFSVKVGSIFEDSPLGLDKWLTGMWMVANCKNGVSSYEIHRAIGITQKSAWFLMHRVRLALQANSLEKLSGEVEADESFIGGKARNMHADKRERKIRGRGPEGKAIVAAVLERGGKIRAQVVGTRKKGDLQKLVRENVEAGSALYSDALKSYEGLSEFEHQVVDHAVEYVRGRVHTNGCENFWSLLKRSINGTYVSVEPYHLFRYVDEQAYRYNNRKAKDWDRFHSAVPAAFGRRVTWKQLTGKREDAC